MEEVMYSNPIWGLYSEFRGIMLNTSPVLSGAERLIHGMTRVNSGVHVQDRS